MKRIRTTLSEYEDEVLVDYEYFPGQKQICNPDEKVQEGIPAQVIILGVTNAETGTYVAPNENQEDLLKVEIFELIREESENLR